MRAVMEKVFENEQKTASIYLEADYIIFKMSGKISLEDYKASFNQLLEQISLFHSKSILFDYSELVSDPALGRAWFLSSFVPKAKSTLTPSSHLAIVQASSMFQRMALSFIVKACHEMGIKFKLQYFDKKEEAANWITEGLSTPV